MLEEGEGGADPCTVNVLENVLSFQESPVDTKNENLISLNHFLTFSIRCFFTFRFVSFYWRNHNFHKDIKETHRVRSGWKAIHLHIGLNCVGVEMVQ